MDNLAPPTGTVMTGGSAAPAAIFKTMAGAPTFSPAPRDRAASAATHERRAALLDVLAQVKTRIQDKLGIVDFPMPKFILIGKQSVGKSRVVEALAGEQFNFCSGTLGSRRPTVLEFRNNPMATKSQWSVQNKDTMKWEDLPTERVLQIIGEAHESLGNHVSETPVNVRLESSECADMAIVDLPGFREFASDESKAGLARDIETMNMKFMNDPRNVMLCVEEAGDAANLGSLKRCMDLDPSHKRTILIRNKLDKYYGDLTPGNVNQWLEGHGDLPKGLKKFAVSMPHWPEGATLDKPFSAMRDDANDRDIRKFQDLRVSASLQQQIGYANFKTYMEEKIEKLFVEAIGPVSQKLNELASEKSVKKDDLKVEIEICDPSKMVSVVQQVGMSFANCLSHTMEGYIPSQENRMTLEDELRAFHAHHKQLGTDCFSPLPSEDFGGLDDYIEYLRDSIRLPAFEVEINGGAQFRRLMMEVEAFLRFSEIGSETAKKRDVLQSFGITMGSITWREVVVKLLNHDGHIPLQRRIAYVGQRIKWFFLEQKSVVLHFMLNLKGSPDEKLYSSQYTKHAKLLQENQTMRALVFDTYNQVCERQYNQFMDLFRSTLTATFANPWVFLKRASGRLEEADIDAEFLLPSIDETKERIPQEMENRGAIEKVLSKWLADIPTEPHKIDDAVDLVQLLVLKVYAIIRSQVCDQVELFSESFFKMPILRRLEEDMSRIELSEVDKQTYQMRREKLETQMTATSTALSEVQECIRFLDDFRRKASVGA